MKPELDAALCEKFPKIFRDRYAHPRTTAMCWGFDVGDGWFELLMDLCEDIQKHCDEIGEQVVATQVKEKFATLRFYVDKGDDTIYDLITKAEHRSARTCEVCGIPGELYGGGWIKTLCADHAKERGYEKMVEEDD